MLRVTGRLRLDISSHPTESAASVLAVRYKYFPWRRPIKLQRVTRRRLEASAAKRLRRSRLAINLRCAQENDGARDQEFLGGLVHHGLQRSLVDLLERR